MSCDRARLSLDPRATYIVAAIIAFIAVAAH
jgi:hypothetical protein